MPEDNTRDLEDTSGTWFVLVAYLEWDRRLAFDDLQGALSSGGRVGFGWRRERPVATALPAEPDSFDCGPKNVVSISFNRKSV